MHWLSLQLRDQDTIEARVTIRLPLEEVFSFYRDFTNLPAFLGDVMAVEQIGPATFRWTIQGPLGIRVNLRIEVTEERRNELISYETQGAAGLKSYWEIHFGPGPHAGQTKIREVMKMPLGRLGRAALSLLGKHPAQEVSANLRRLKEIMETGRVTDGSYTVAGKFAGGSSNTNCPVMPRTESKPRFLLYGAYGYTGRLAAELAVAKGFDVVLAGRNNDALAELGDRLRLPTRVVGLDDAKQRRLQLRSWVPF